jgi:hypothetical protein
MSNMPVGMLSNFGDYHSVVEDFDGKAFNATDVWTVIKDASATVALNSADNGELLISSAATTDNDGGSIQMVPSFLVKSGKKLWFEARVKVSSAADCDMFIGLAETHATDPEAVVVDGIARVGFELVDGSAVIQSVIDNDTAATRVSTTISAADATYVRLGFRTDGASIRFYVNRSLTNTRDIPSAIAAKLLSPTFFGLSGSASGTHTRAIDYMIAVQERA